MPGSPASAIGSILVAVDGSKSALAACRVAASIAGAAHAAITLLYVDLTSAAEPRRVEPTAPSEIVRKQRIMDEAVSAVGDNALIIGRKAVSERASVVRAITEYADSGDFDLVVLGTRGLGGFKRLTIGSVSSGVATHARKAVLVVRSDPTGKEPPLRHIAAAADGSPNSKHAVGAAARLAKTLGAELEIVHVIHVPEISHAPTTLVPLGEIEEGARSNGERVLAEAASLAQSEGVSAKCKIKKGVSPAQGIVDYADANHTDLIVIGARGLGRFRKLLLGSVSNSVLHYANCSVLVVK